MREVILDTETTGFAVEEHRILEIGCVELVNKLPTGVIFHKYLNPDREIDWQSTRVHGITAEKVAECPRFADIAGELLDFLGDSPVVAHNASFDVSFLNMEFAKAGFPDLACPVVDTLVLARQKLPGQRVGLDALCKFYNVDNSARTYHGALLDAQLLADVYVELMGGLQGSLLGEESGIRQREPGVDVLDGGAFVAGFGVSPVVEPTPEELEAHGVFVGKIKGSRWNEVL